MAARISFQEIASLPDVADAVSFNILFGTIPGTGDTKHLSLKCQTISIPGFSNERITTTLHGHSVNFRGRKMYPQTLATQFVETSNLETIKAIRNWHEIIAGSNSNNSVGYKSDYSIDVLLEVYDTTGRVADEHLIEAFFPNDVSDTALSGESSAAMTQSITFSYDRFLGGAGFIER